MKNIITVIGVLSLASILILWPLAYTSTNTSQQYSTSVPIQSPAASTKATLVINSIQEVQQFPYNYNRHVTSAHPGMKFPYNYNRHVTSAHLGMKLIIVNETMQNMGVKGLWLGNMADFTLKASDNVTYVHSANTFDLPNPAGGMVTGPNQKVTGQVMFEIDQKAKPEQLIYDGAGGVKITVNLTSNK
jgi:hypothetical protein